MREARLQHCGYYQLRTPALPVEDFDRLTAALDGDPAGWHQQLATAIAAPDVGGPIRLASPSLLSAVDGWRHEEGSAGDRSSALALFRYLTRMATRSTPFGLLAGWTLGRVAAETRHELSESTPVRRVRVSFPWLADLAFALAADPEHRLDLRYTRTETFRAEPSVVEWIRLAESGDPPAQIRVRARVDAGARRMLAGLDGPQSGRCIVAALEAEGVAAPQAGQWLGEFIRLQLLVPALVPPAVGADPLQHVATELRQSPRLAPLAAALVQAQTSLGRLATAEGATAYEGYEHVEQRLVALRRTELRTDQGTEQRYGGSVFEADLEKPGVALLGESVVNDVLRAVDALWRLQAGHTNRDLDRFTAVFYARYRDEEVPLLEAIDERRGVGLPWLPPAPDLAVVLGTLATESSEVQPWARRDSWLLKKYATSLRDGSGSLRIRATELQDGSLADVPPMPASFSVLLSLLGGTSVPASLADAAIHTVYGPDATSLLARFARGTGLEPHVLRTAAAERELFPDAIVAEVVHLPEPGLGAVVSRPHMGGVEILAGAASGSTEVTAIRLRDLTLRVVAGHLCLRSRSHDARVIPRLSSAHNFRGRGMGVYRLLCLLQAETEFIGGWAWGPLAPAPFLPRVVFERVLLSPATWNLDAPTTRRIATEPFNRTHLPADLPARVTVVDRGRPIEVDLSTAAGGWCLKYLAGKNSVLSIQESLVDSTSSAVTGPHGHYAHEIVLPVLNTEADRRAVTSPRPSSSARRCGPGSDWLYLRLYSSVDAIDEALVDLVRPLVAELTAGGSVESWHFLRYAKPDWHARLRFHGDSAVLSREVYPKCAEILGRSVRILEVGTYERELERFGGDAGLATAERIFAVDSAAALDAMAAMRATRSTAEERWFYTFAACWSMAAASGLSMQRRVQVFRRKMESNAKLAALTTAGRRQIGDVYRSRRDSLVEATRQPPSYQGHPFAANAVLGARHDRLRPLFDQLRTDEERGLVSTPADVVLGDLLHLAINRLSPRITPPQETAVFDFLLRTARAAANA